MQPVTGQDHRSICKPREGYRSPVAALVELL
jgi:hypothetical protein